VEFTPTQLKQLDPYDKYSWNWLFANDTAGGIIVGISVDLFDVIRWDIHIYYVSVLIKNKKDGIMWIIISVYGSAYEDHKLDFINELHNVYANWMGSTLVGGDFNLIRKSCEKNTGNINQHWADLFNEWINKFGLMEIKNVTIQFTWGNNQENMIMDLLDSLCIYLLR
jgi:hypothetical protein